MPSNQTIGGGGFHHVAIRAHDFDASVKFYTQVMGFIEKITWNQSPQRAIMLDVGDGNYLEIFERPSESWKDTDASILHFALRTTDPDAAIARVRAAGMTVTVEPKSLDIPSNPPTPVRLAFFRGPDGEIIEFFSNNRT